MAVESQAERRVPTCFSAAIMATIRGESALPPTNELYFTDRLILVRNQKSLMWSPPAGKSKLINDILEQPEETAIREWSEETGLDLSSHLDDPAVLPLRLFRVYFSYDVDQGEATVGFIFDALLKKDTFNLFPVNSIDPLIHDPIPIANSFETDMIGVFNVHQVGAILRNWQTQLRLPHINGDQLLDWYNGQLFSLSGFQTDKMQPKLKREELGFHWRSSFVRTKQSYE